MFDKVFKYFANGTFLIWVTIFFFVIIILESSYIVFSKKSDEVVDSVNESLAIESKPVEEEKTITISKIHVDIKGAVKKPGVYEMDSNLLITDAINIAGGLLKNAYTDNLNLSKKLSDNMVIYIFTKSEFKKLNTKVDANVVCQTNVTEVNECVDQGISVIKTETEEKENVVNVTADNSDNQSGQSGLININTATEEQLTSLTGIGLSKAKAIISYRQENGNFNSIDEIKNVSGIGEAVFEKIKDSITI